MPAINFAEEFSSKIPALTLLTTLGYQFIPPSQCHAMRTKATSTKATAQVVLLPIMRDFLAQQTFIFAGKSHHLSEAAIDNIIHTLTPAMNLGLQTANETLYDAMLYGVTVTEFIDGKRTSQTIDLIDWNNTDNNSFHFTEEFVVLNSEGTGSRRPDIVCFVNGLPLVVIEAKRPDSNREGQSTNAQAVSQHIRNQHQKEIPHLFAFSQLLLAVNGHDGLYGTCGTPEKFWAKWIEEEIPEAEFARLKNQRLNDEQIASLFNYRPLSDKNQYLSLMDGGELVVTDQDRLIISLLQPERLLEMTRLFTLFDKKVGKIVARYQQVFGIKTLIERVSTFDGSDNSNNKQGSRQGGVIWHTTGSGKSFTMVFFSKALIWLEALKECRIIVVTDRVDLETQLSNTFKSGGVMTSKRDSRDAMATSGRRLAEQIGQGNERVIFSIINKFGSAVDYPECYNDSPNIIVMVDEGHRSQNGENNILMNQALPNAAFIAFTGTPLLKDDKTENKFGSIIHSYTMQQAVADKTVTPLLYEERVPELNTNDAAIDSWFERITQKLSEEQKSDLKRKFSSRGQIYQTEGRIELIAHDISDHFQNFKQQHLKGQLACDSKASAIRYKIALDKIGKVSSVVAMSAPDTREGHDSVDGESKDIVQNWWQANVVADYGGDEKAYTRAIIEDFSTDNGPDIMIVVDKLLTGFDEPKNTVLYIDKPLKQHNLIQAIARVNRLHEKKRFGYLIDYRGVLTELDITIEKYQDLAERTQCGFDIEDLQGLYNAMDTEYKQLPRLHNELWAIFAAVKNKQDGQALRQVLAPKMQEIDGRVVDTVLKDRDDFYAALTAFSNAMKVALQSTSFFADSAFDNKRERYKTDLKAFVNLRKQVREDADETIDYDEYEADIRSLLDKHIAGLEVREAKGVYLVDNLGKLGKMGELGKMAKVNELGKDIKPNELSDDEARNQTDKITGRVTRMIEQDLADDPYAQEYFSKLLKQAIADAKAMFDAPVKQYMMFTDFEQAVAERQVTGVPNVFIDGSGKLNRHAQAYFGLFKQLLDADFDNNSLGDKELDNSKLVLYAFEIDKVVNTAVAEYSINPAEIENAISVQLLPMLFADLGIDKAQQLIEKVLKITRLGLSRAAKSPKVARG